MARDEVPRLTPKSQEKGHDMTTDYTVGCYLIDRLRELGVHHLFGVPGDFAFPFLNLVEQTQGLQWTGNCNELNAAYAADGYAQAGERAGAFVVTAAVGELSASCGIAGSYAEHVPTVCIAGYPGTDEMAQKTYTHHSFNGGDFSPVPRMMTEITTDSAVLTPEDPCEVIDRILQACWREKLPVYMCFPRDVQKMVVAPPATKLDLSDPASDPTQLNAFADAAADIVGGAQRPAILVDTNTGRFHFTAAVQDFADAAGLPFAVTSGGKTAFVDESHPNYVGLYLGQTGDQAATSAIQEADVLLRFCLTHSELLDRFGSPDSHPCTTIDFQPTSVTVGGKTYTDVSLRDALSALQARITKRSNAITSLRSTLRREPFVPAPGTALTHDRLWDAIADLVAADDVICLEQATSMVGLHMPLPARGKVLFQQCWSAIGGTLPTMVGAMIASPHLRHIMIAGDGAFQVTAQELSTIVRLGLAPIIILQHNDVYAVENTTNERGYGDMAYNDLQPWHYENLPDLFDGNDRGNVRGIRAATEEELARALEDAATTQNQGICTLIVVPVPKDEVPTQLKNDMAVYGANTGRWK